MNDQPNPDTNFKVIDKRSPETQARKAEMPDYLPDATKMMLKPCPFCGGEAEIVRYGNTRMSTQCQCTECGCKLESGEIFNHGSSWNYRTPAPMTSVIEWHRYDGRPETLPEKDRPILTSMNRFKFLFHPNFPRNLWQIGDLWAYLPTPPEGAA